MEAGTGIDMLWRMGSRIRTVLKASVLIIISTLFLTSLVGCIFRSFLPYIIKSDLRIPRKAPVSKFKITTQVRHMV